MHWSKDILQIGRDLTHNWGIEGDVHADRLHQTNSVSAKEGKSVPLGLHALHDFSHLHGHHRQQVDMETVEFVQAAPGACACYSMEDLG